MDMTYTLLANGMVRRGDDTFIPPDEGNRDYQEFLAWKALGNEPLVEEKIDVAQLPPSPSLEELVERIAALEMKVKELERR